MLRMLFRVNHDVRKRLSCSGRADSTHNGGGLQSCFAQRAPGVCDVRNKVFNALLQGLHRLAIKTGECCKMMSVCRDCIKKTFETKGLDYISELALENVRALPAIYKWNQEHGIQFFR